MSAPLTISISRPKLLLGEGKDELRVFEAMVKYLQLEHQIQVLEYGGKSKLPPFLRTLPNLAGFNQLESLGITRDADASAVGARKSIQTLLENSPFPAVLRVGVFVLPGGERSGALEDICCDALGTNPVWQCIDQFVGCRTEKLGAWPNPAATTGKAKLEAWLSTRDNPTIRLGEATAAGLMAFDSPAFAPLLQFMRSL